MNTRKYKPWIESSMTSCCSLDSYIVAARSALESRYPWEGEVVSTASDAFAISALDTLGDIGKHPNLEISLSSLDIVHSYFASETECSRQRWVDWFEWPLHGVCFPIRQEVRAPSKCLPPSKSWQSVGRRRRRRRTQGRSQSWPVCSANKIATEQVSWFNDCESRPNT